MGRKILRDIRRSSEFEDLYNRLGSREYRWPQDSRPEGAPLFGTIRELMCFAAVLGFQTERREELVGPTHVIPEEVFAKNDDALECLRMIALAESKDHMVFAEERVDEMVTIFEEYACGGTRLIQSFLTDMPTDALGADAILEGLRREQLLPSKKGPSSTSIEAVTF